MIYLDNSATTKPLKQAIERQNNIDTENFYNCSTLYSGGINSGKLLTAARKSIAFCLGADSEEIIFTSSGTLSDNIAIFGGAKVKQGKIICSEVEHAAVYNCFMELKNKGYNVEFAKADKTGALDIEHFKSILTRDTGFVSIMHTNNITGAINDIKSISRLIKSYNKQCVFHSDGVQAFCKTDTNVKDLEVDLYTVSSHKINGTRGAAALYKKKTLNLAPYIFGGGQENGIFSGTENLAAICAFETAALYHKNNFAFHIKQLNSLRAYLIEKLQKINNIIIVDGNNFAPHIVNLSIENIKSEVLQQYLSKEGIYIATGSACSSNFKVSRFNKPLNLPKTFEEGNIRLSLSFENTKSEIDIFIGKFKIAIEILKSK